MRAYNVVFVYFASEILKKYLINVGVSNYIIYITFFIKIKKPNKFMFNFIINDCDVFSKQTYIN